MTALAGVADRRSSGVEVLPFFAACSMRAAARAGSFLFLSMCGRVAEREARIADRGSRVADRRWEGGTSNQGVWQASTSVDTLEPFPACAKVAIDRVLEMDRPSQWLEVEEEVEEEEKRNNSSRQGG